MKNILLASLILFVLASCKQEPKSKTTITIYSNSLKSIDGPYIYDLNDSLNVVTVKKHKDSTFYISENNLKKLPSQLFTCEVSNTDNDSFSFGLIDDYIVPNALHDSENKIFVTSDIEGNFNAFYTMLLGNKIIDKNYNWTFGDGHLVIAGDMMDRGHNVIPCLWLLYKLEQDAKKFGGQVHFILGNHDVMNIQLDIRYVRSKYIDLAKAISGEEDEKLAYQYLMSNHNELVKWIKSKNAVEKIGNNLFLHGGISPEVVDANLSIEEINTLIRGHIDELLIRTPGDNDRANLVLGRMGPLWYRGLVIDYKEHYQKVSLEDLDKILAYYNVEHIIVGHTIVDDQVTSDFNGKVIRVDIKHAKEKFSGKSEALLIEGNNYYKANENGERILLYK